MIFTATDIFSAMFGLPTDKTAKFFFAEVKSQIDTKLIDKQHQYPMDLHKIVQNSDMIDSFVDLTPKHEHDIQNISNVGSLEPTTHAGIF